MLRPEFRSSWLNKICFKVDLFFEHWPTKFFLAPLLIYAPVYFLLAIFSEPSLQEKISGYLSPQSISFVSKYNLIILFFLFATISLGTGARLLIKKYGKPVSCLSRDDVVAILDVIGKILEGKQERFLKKTKEALDNNWTPGKTFNEITKPDQQLALLTYGAREIFSYLFKSEVDFRVGLMRIKEDKPVEWCYFIPKEKPPKTTIEELKDQDSSIKKALQKRGMLIIDDIQKELRKPDGTKKFINGSTTESDEGSILTLPIYCPNTCQAIYVLSIFGNKKNALTNKNRDLYEWVLSNFVSRIILEHHLLIMKDGVP